MKLYKYLLRFKESEYKYEVYANHQFWAEQFINNDIRFFDMQNQLSEKKYDNYSVLDMRKLFELDVDLTEDKNILKTYEPFMNLEDEKTVIMRKRELVENSKLFGFLYEEWQTVLLPSLNYYRDRGYENELIICHNVELAMQETLNGFSSDVEILKKEFHTGGISIIRFISNGKNMRVSFVSKNFNSQSLRGLRVDKISLSKY